ncbi:hypothetical protein B296_00030782 [Ensete ventricosum]|uniref:Uncharacterized protein n=1 Tax=Ensete ventricosum TaxID=4639 RepID=A0A427A3H1_ENSVE|nr:hypothetical protein B296_00030782 [Ensete ventricosum]
MPNQLLTVYDVTKRETFTNLADVWVKEVELYATNHNCVKVLVGNKVDKILEVPKLVEEGSVPVKRIILKQQQQQQQQEQQQHAHRGGGDGCCS